MKYTIGDLAEIIDGDRGKNYPQQHEFSDEGYCLFLNTGNVTKEGFSFNSNQYITKAKSDLLRKGKLQRRDIVYTTRGTVGNAAFYSDDIPYEHIRINSGMMIIRPKEELVCTEFLYQILKSEYYRPYFRRYCTGSAQPQLPIKNFITIELDIPDLQSQRHIADILSTYDALIENNQKQIKLLEEAAQRLYKEWFVDLRFPGHENVKIVDGVPEGWRTVKLSDVANVNKACISERYPYDYVDYVDLGSVSRGHIEAIARILVQGAPSRAKRLAFDGDIIWGMVRPNLKSYALVLHPSETSVYSTGFAVLSAQKVPFSFLYCCVTQDDFVSYLVNCTNGAAYPAVKPDHFREAAITLPTDSLLRQFNLIAEPMYRKIEILEKQIKRSKEARDRLLPILMNREIEV